MEKRITLSKEVVAILATSVTTNSTVERSDKDLFLLAFKEYKKTSKAQRGHITNLLNVEVGKLTKSTNVQNTLKRVFKLAFNYVDMKVIVKFDNLEYTNISNLVKLFKYVDKHLEDKSKELRATFAELYEDDMSPHRYNNVVASKIVELKEEYKLKEQEGEFVFTEALDTIKGMLTNMNEAQVLELLAVVQAKYDRVTEVQEVA